MDRKNLIRGYKKLRVWQDAVELYVMTCKTLSNLPFELKKVTSNAIDSSHSISRNIAEGYCRKSLKDYLKFIYIALGSSGEYHTCIFSMHNAKQISDQDFELLDGQHYKTENGLLQLVKSLQAKLHNGEWNENLLDINPCLAGRQASSKNPKIQ